LPHLKKKNLAVAIGLNWLLPGSGYLYMGKPVVGVLALVFSFVVGFVAPIAIVLVPLVAAMVIDMVVLNVKRNKAIAAAQLTSAELSENLSWDLPAGIEGEQP